MHARAAGGRQNTEQVARSQNRRLNVWTGAICPVGAETDRQTGRGARQGGSTVQARNYREVLSTKRVRAIGTHPHGMGRAFARKKTRGRGEPRRARRTGRACGATESGLRGAPPGRRTGDIVLALLRRSCRAAAALECLAHVSGTAVAPRPGSVVSVSAMGRSHASISSCFSSAMRG